MLGCAAKLLYKKVCMFVPLSVMFFSFSIVSLKINQKTITDIKDSIRIDEKTSNEQKAKKWTNCQPYI